MENIVYQIKLTGQYKHFSNIGRLYSQKIYKKYPTEKIINDFIKSCTKDGMTDLYNNDKLKVTIIELILID